jgi:hypothetical protein
MKTIETSSGKRTDPRCCVWMDAGIVSYKLCSRNHRCGACQFDQRITEALESEVSPLRALVIAEETAEAKRRAA